MEEYTRIEFSQVSFDYAVLDRFNALCDYELRTKEEGKFNIYDLQTGEYVFENDLEIAELLKVWVEKAKGYFEDEYLDNIQKTGKQKKIFLEKNYTCKK